MNSNKNNNNQKGFTLVELLLALFCGSIVLAGAYASYTVISDQYQRNSGLAEIRDFAMPTLKLLTRDIRMAGYTAVDSNTMLSNYGSISYANSDPDPSKDLSPVKIDDNFNNNIFDKISVVYDKVLDDRYRVSYYVGTKGDHYALYTDIEKWNGASWDPPSVSGAIVADYVEDFQIEGYNNGAPDGLTPNFIGLNIVFRSRSQTKSLNTFDKADYGYGKDNNFTTSKYYLFEEFDAAVKLRNL